METGDLYPICCHTGIYLVHLLSHLSNHEDLCDPLVKYWYPEIILHSVTYI